MSEFTDYGVRPRHFSARHDGHAPCGYASVHLRINLLILN